MPRPTILVVDDEGTILTLLAHALGGAGFVVLTAGSGNDAVKLCADWGEMIDLVLLDVRMPAPWDGPTTLCELRRLRPLGRVAFMSGSTGEYTVEELLALGAVRVFSKPFASLGDLAAALRELVPA